VAYRHFSVYCRLVRRHLPPISSIALLKLQLQLFQHTTYIEDGGSFYSNETLLTSADAFLSTRVFILTTTTVKKKEKGIDIHPQLWFLPTF